MKEENISIARAGNKQKGIKTGKKKSECETERRERKSPPKECGRDQGEKGKKRGKRGNNEEKEKRSCKETTEEEKNEQKGRKSMLIL